MPRLRPFSLEEKEMVLAKLAEGLPDKVVAKRLGWSVRTLAYIKEQIREDMGTDSSFQMGMIYEKSRSAKSQEDC